jgi:hypothetical protein
MKGFNILDKTLLIHLKKVAMSPGHILLSIDKWVSPLILFVLYLQDQSLLFKYSTRRMDQGQQT